MEPSAGLLVYPLHAVSGVWSPVEVYPLHAVSGVCSLVRVYPLYAVSGVCDPVLVGLTPSRDEWGM